jgi:hypothetical protein
MAALAALFALTGCESAVTGLYGSAATEAASPRPTLAAEGGTDGAAPRRLIVDFDPATECPQINVPSGSSSYGTFAGEASPANYRYQARIAEFARECTMASGDSVAIKIGIEGLMILGEKGSPGTFTAPLRITVRDVTGKTVAERVERITVTIPPGRSQAPFRIVQEAAVVPIGPTLPLRSYEIEIGFQDGAGGKARQRG